MNIIPRQYFLSTLVGISFTSLSLALIYYWYKDEDRTKNLLYTGQNKLKKDIKVKRKCVPALIGRAGFTIKDIQNKSETWINFKDDDLQYSYRTCTIAGTKEGIDLAEAMIKNLIADHAVIETYEMYVPVQECQKIIGLCENNETKLNINTKTHANITVEKAMHQSDNKQKVIINGTSSQIANIIHYIESKVLEQKYKDKELSAYINKLGFCSLKTQLALFSYDSIIDVDIYVVVVKDIQTIYVRLFSEDESLYKLHVAMADYYKKLENRQIQRLKFIKRGQIVTAKCKEDGCWYRAEVLEVFYSYVTVSYIDFGFIRMIHQKNVLDIDSKFTKMRAQAIECQLIHIEPIPNTVDANQMFFQMAIKSRRTLRARIRGYTRRVQSMGKLYPVNSPCPLIELFDQTLSLNDLFIKKGYAKKCDYTDSQAYIIPSNFSSDEWSIKQYGMDSEIINNECDLSKEIYVDSDDEQYEHRTFKPRMYHFPKYAFPNDGNGGWYSVENSEDEYDENKDWYFQNGLQEEFYENRGRDSDKELLTGEQQEQGEEGKNKKKYEMDKSEMDKSEMDKSEMDKSEMDKSEVDKSEVDKSEVDKSEVDKSEVEESEVEESEVEESEVDESDMNDEISLSKRNEVPVMKYSEEEDDDDEEVRKKIKELRKEEEQLELDAQNYERELEDDLFDGEWSYGVGSVDDFYPGPGRHIRIGNKIIYDARPRRERLIEKRQERKVIRLRKIREFREQRRREKGIISSDDKNNESNKEETIEKIDFDSKYSGRYFYYYYIKGDEPRYKDIYDVSKDPRYISKIENTSEISNHNNHKKEQDENGISNDKNDHEEKKDQNGISNHKNDHEVEKVQNGISDHKNDHEEKKDQNGISDHNNHKKEHDDIGISNHKNNHEEKEYQNGISNHKNNHEEKEYQNGISDHKNDQGEQCSTKLENPELNNSSHLIPAGFESDISDEFDGFELG